MLRLTRAHIVLCLIALSPALVRAQKEAAPSKTNKQAAVKRAGSNNPLAEQRRMTAITLISTLADDARGYQDAVLRARVLARAADALWETDAERARNYKQTARAPGSWSRRPSGPATPPKGSRARTRASPSCSATATASSCRT